jgi:hypothetical protein
VELRCLKMRRPAEVVAETMMTMLRGELKEVEM